MLRASSNERRRNDPSPDRVFSLRRIIGGDFDADLRRWADDARAFGTPVLAEYGTEMNGFWFGWNATHNGVQDGARRFRLAYRHIITIMRARGADNVSWVFHVNDDDQPAKPWNRLERYYPGDRYIDWLATSVYGALTPQEHWNEPFARGMDRVYPRLRRLADKPILVSEFGVTKNNPRVDPVRWADQAFEQLLSDRWPRVRGFSWWNETWENDDVAAHDSNLRIQDIPGLPQLFSLALADPHVLTRPLP
jgi:beta-mannanase